MKTKFILLLLATLILFSCSKVPEGIIQEDKMEDILIDLFLAEGTASVKGLQSGAEKKERYYNSVLKKHDVTYAQFDSSTVWYSQNSELYFKLLERVHERLQKLQKEIEEGKYIALASNEALFDTLTYASVPKELLLTFPSQLELPIFDIADTTNVKDDTYMLGFRVQRKPIATSLNAAIEVTYLLKDGQTKTFTTNLFTPSDSPYIMSYLVEDSPVVNITAHLYCYDAATHRPVRLYLKELSFVRIRAKI